MKILIVNDDGAGASGLLPLIRWCEKLGQVTVMVPKFEQSGKSHGIEIHKSFEVKQMELEPGTSIWTVDSTPADCVRIAVLGQKRCFDLVISGVNRGLNLGADMMYSGTIGAACEAVNLGIPAVAFSTTPKNYHRSTEELDRVWAFFQKHRLLERHMLYNVNIPQQPAGIRITHQGGPYFSDEFAQEDNHMLRPCGKPVWNDSHDDTLDTDATLHGYITVTPLTINKTDWKLYQELSGLSE